MTTSAARRRCQYDTLTYQPQGQAPELKYFLMQFVTQHFARMRATVKERYAESLYFLDAALGGRHHGRSQRQHQTIETFLAGSGDEIDVQVKNVTLDDLTTPPYKATVDFEKVYYAPGNRQERARETLRRAAHVRAARPDSRTPWCP